jgi:hypothetical protein
LLSLELFSDNTEPTHELEEASVDFSSEKSKLSINSKLEAFKYKKPTLAKSQVSQPVKFSCGESESESTEVNALNALDELINESFSQSEAKANFMPIKDQEKPKQKSSPILTKTGSIKDWLIKYNYVNDKKYKPARNHS